MTSPTPMKDNWEDRFDERFHYTHFTWNGDNATGKHFAQAQKMKVKAFIRAEISSAQKELARELIAEVEGMKENIPPYPMEGPNAEMITWAARHAHFFTLDDILKLLRRKANLE